MIFGKSTNSVVCTGSAAAAAYQQGAIYANGEFIQVHPTAIPGEDKVRLMSESARSEGGRMWVPRDGKPWYFLEEKYPKYKNLVPRDIATREIYHICRVLKLGIDGQDMVYLDVSHIPKETLDRKLGGILEIYEKFIGDDPRKVPMKVFPGVHYSMGGLWIDYEADNRGDPVAESLGTIRRTSRGFSRPARRTTSTMGRTAWGRIRSSPASTGGSWPGPPCEAT